MYALLRQLVINVSVGPSLLPGLSCALLRRAFCAEVNDSAAVGALFATESTSDRLEIVPMFFRDRRANCSNLFNDGVSPHELCLHQFFGSTDDWCLQASGPTGPIDLATDGGICNVSAIPRHEVRDAIHGGDGNMEGVGMSFSRHDSSLEQLSS